LRVTPDLLRIVRRVAGPAVAITAAFTLAGLAMDRWEGPEWPYEAGGSWRVLARSIEGLGAASVALPPSSSSRACAWATGAGGRARSSSARC
jgi:hypothetical protein